MRRFINVGPFSVDAMDNLSFIYSMTDLLISFFAYMEFGCGCSCEKKTLKMRKLWNEDDIYVLNISSYYPGCNSVQNLTKTSDIDTKTPLACLFKDSL